MAKQTEITVQVFDSASNVKNKLVSSGYKIVEEYFMKDYYFSKYNIDNLNEMEYLSIIDNSFLVRYIKDNDPKTLLIHKKKQVDNNGDVISEVKTSCKVDNLNNAVNLFNNAGLTNWCVVSAFMTVFKKDNISFVLQDVENLGLFIEYEENKTMSNLLSEQKIEVMKKTLNGLNLNLGSDFSCKKVYMLFKNKM